MSGYRVGLPFWRTAARMGITVTLPVEISFDGEANVYIATSPSLPGLAAEADSLDELRRQTRLAMDDLMEIALSGHHGAARPRFRFRDSPVTVA